MKGETMDLTRKVRLYPNKTMLTILDTLCDYRRYCWNQALDVWMSLYQQRQKHVPRDLRLKVKQAIKDKSIAFTDDENELLRQYPAPTHYTVRDILTKNKQDWQYQLSSRVLRLAVADLAKAWRYFFNNKENKALHAGKPTFRQKKNPKQGFKTDSSRIQNGKLLLEKPRKYKGDWYAIPFKGYSLPDGDIKYCSITKINNKYYASLIIDTPIEPLAKTGRNTAVDANVNHFDYTDGQYAINPQRLDTIYAQIAFYQKRLARKHHVNGKKASESKSYTVMRAKLQTLYEKATAIQNDLLHKFTTYLYRTYDIIVIEDLDVKSMQMSKKAKNLHRSLFGKFRFQMEYKAKKFNKKLIIADRYYASTQRCSQCGTVKTGDNKITLMGNAKHGTAHNEYICYECGYKADRDMNAVMNLLALIK
jgi:transposase, IS605 orfB family